ncbi:neuronal pentraxin-1-like [Clavelina lepadiformis]|uniref:neuronal pentraxin-1-like n=1 Tax=Clavelina lepadiformis TaxID=159417 RepID=UPI004041B02A
MRIILHFFASAVCIAIVCAQDSFTCVRNVNSCSQSEDQRTTSGQVQRALPGKQGPVGMKGEKGDPGTPDQEQINRLKDRVAFLEKEIQDKSTANQRTTDCPLIAFKFPRYQQITDYVRYRSYFPELPQATICAWIESTEPAASVVPAIMSYAVPGHTNELLIEIGRDRNFRILTNDRLLRKFALSSSKWPYEKIHFCAFYSQPAGVAGLFLNGVLHGTLLVTQSAVSGGGDLVFGQDQDAVNAGGFNPTQAFSGNITNPMIWPRLLTASEISGIVRHCVCPKDYAIVMTLDRVELHGNVEYFIPDVCPTL